MWVAKILTGVSMIDRADGEDAGATTYADPCSATHVRSMALA